MTVYVDDLVQWGATGAYRGKDADHAERVGARNDHRWCHMFSDEADCTELHAFARRIGLKREWFQNGNHYDLTPGRRARAVALGAVEADRATSVAIWKNQKDAARAVAALHARPRCIGCIWLEVCEQVVKDMAIPVCQEGKSDGKETEGG